MIDIVIVGGGVAGLWTLTRLRRLGYQAILIESESLGNGQTLASQGIIHGGTKYALTGKLTHSSQSIGEMPELWRNCLAGSGEMDLKRVKILSSHQYLWANPNIGSRLAGFFAGKVMHSRIQALKREGFPKFFSSEAFRGSVYQLDEPVLDSFSLVKELARQNKDAIYSMRIREIEKIATGYRLFDEEKQLEAKYLIFTAGNGNRKLLDLLNFKQPQMQQRPLHQPLLKSPKGSLPLIYAHCLGTSALPRLTITAYEKEDEVIWYLGGEIAEKGVGRTLEEQIIKTKEELGNWIPWFSFQHCKWSAYKIDRAEPKMSDGSRPVEPYVSEQAHVITAWPVKLAMTPLMVDAILNKIKQLNLTANPKTIELNHFSKPDVAKMPWQLQDNWQ